MNKPTSTGRVVAYTTRDGWEFTREQIDAVVQLIRDPARLVALGLGPAFVEALRDTGWLSPEKSNRLEKDRGNDADSSS